MRTMSFLAALAAVVLTGFAAYAGPLADECHAKQKVTATEWCEKYYSTTPDRNRCMEDMQRRSYLSTCLDPNHKPRS